MPASYAVSAAMAQAAVANRHSGVPDSVSAMTIGGQLRAARLRRGISQASLARRAGTKQATISRLEAGRESPTIERLDRLASVLGLTAVVTLEPRGVIDPDAVAAARALSPAERLRESLSWNLVATSLEVAAAKARRR